MFNKTEQAQKLNNSHSISSYSAALFGLLFTFFVFFLSIETSFAEDVTDVAENIVNNVSQLPWFISAIAYLTGVYFGAVGVDKLRQHVENPAQVKIGAATGHFLGGGALLALPTIYSAMMKAFSGGTSSSYDYDEAFSPTNFMSALMGGEFDLVGGFLGDINLTRDVNAVLATILDSVGGLSHIFTAFAYLIGLYMGFLAVLKLKDYIEDPERNPLKEALARFFIGGAFFALPTIYTMMTSAIVGNGDSGSILGLFSGLSDSLSFMESVYNPEKGCTDDAVNGMIDGMTGGVGGTVADMITGAEDAPSLGDAMCNLYRRTASFPAFLAGVAKLLGFFFGFWALLKLRDHMADPRSTPISQAVNRFLAGGCFLALQAMIDIVRSTTTPTASELDDLLGNTITSYSGIPQECASSSDGWASDLLGSITGAISGAVDNASSAASSLLSGDVNGAACAIGLGSDCDSGQQATSAAATGFGKQVYCAVSDILGPMHIILNFLTFSAGVALLMVGISRLLKSEQDGPRAPAGIGTIVTFITAGVLISFNDFVRMVTMTLFGSNTTATAVTMSYTAGLDTQEIAEFQATISGVIKFMILIGLISFVRGVFILRGVAEGNQQSSMMAGMTHIIGGVLAVNIGPFLNLVQATLGIGTDMQLVFG
ncbi:MAG TPA: hypothetical protein DIU06_00925 [Rhodospirillaceae bacterium]|nr:hypothetical protein [Rhodospirillaceae bacterium]